MYFEIRSIGLGRVLWTLASVCAPRNVESHFLHEECTSRTGTRLVRQAGASGATERESPARFLTLYDRRCLHCAQFPLFSHCIQPGIVLSFTAVRIGELSIRLSFSTGSNHFGIHVTTQMLSERPAIATELRCYRPLHKPIVEILERHKDHDLRGLFEPWSFREWTGVHLTRESALADFLVDFKTHAHGLERTPRQPAVGSCVSVAVARSQDQHGLSTVISPCPRHRRPGYHFAVRRG